MPLNVHRRPADVRLAAARRTVTLDRPTLDRSVVARSSVARSAAAGSVAARSFIAAGVLLALGACSDDDDGDAADLDAPVDVSMEGETDPDASGDPEGAPDVEGTPDTASAPGTFQFLFRNTSATQPMTPPVVAIHTAPDGDAGIRLFEVGQPAIEPVIAIAEDGDNAPLVELLTEQAGTTVSASGVAFADPSAPGPLLPGQSATLDLSTAEADQVMSVVAMVVCTNDGFSGIDSAPLPETTVSVDAPIHDAGSEINVLLLNYWVPPCGGGDENLHDDEGGVVAAHPGQDGSENPDFDFAPGTALLEVTVTRN